MSWLEKLLPPKIQHTDPSDRRSVPEGIWVKCPSCGHHHRISARTRLNAFLDGEGRYEIGQEVVPVDALKFLSLIHISEPTRH